MVVFIIVNKFFLHRVCHPREPVGRVGDQRKNLAEIWIPAFARMTDPGMSKKIYNNKLLLKMLKDLLKSNIFVHTQFAGVETLYVS